jgi:hypothetical protein
MNPSKKQLESIKQYAKYHNCKGIECWYCYFADDGINMCNPDNGNSDEKYKISKHILREYKLKRINGKL